MIKGIDKGVGTLQVIENDYFSPLLHIRNSREGVNGYISCKSDKQMWFLFHSIKSLDDVKKFNLKIKKFKS